MLYLYIRASTDKQENSVEAQTDRLKEWAARSGLEVGGVYPDVDVSAHSVPLKERPFGKQLWDLLQPGDTVAFTKVDRAFRSLADAAPALQVWKQLGVKVRILDLDIDVSTPTGKLFFSQLVAFAQFESELHGQRKREVYAYKRSTGQPYNQLRPWGWLAIKGKSGRLSGWAPCPAEQTLGNRITKMRAKGMAWQKIATTLCLEGVQKPVRRQGSSAWYHVSDVRSLAQAAAAGYPMQPQAYWQARVPAPTPPAAKSDDARQSSAASGRA
jgi:DNA invertase Pin-like site-specific DNA recombinase